MSVLEPDFRGFQGGFHVESFGVAPDTYAPGRRCFEEGCITVLSVYNGGPWCWCHAAKHEAEVTREAERIQRLRSGGPNSARNRRWRVERDRFVVRLLDLGRPVGDVALLVGVSPSKIGQVAAKARERAA